MPAMLMGTPQAAELLGAAVDVIRRVSAEEVAFADQHEQRFRGHRTRAGPGSRNPMGRTR